MPRAPKQCGHRDCDTRVVGRTYCDEHTIPWQGSHRGGSRPWRTIRERILKRDAYICYLCGRPGADTVDHVRPVSQGGTDDDNNLRAVHDRVEPHCHRRKSSSEGNNTHRPPG